MDIKDKREGSEVGLFKCITNKEYHAGEGVNNSKLNTMLDCPAKINDVIAETPAMKFGTLFHMLMLEPDDFKRKVKHLDFSGTTKAGKEQKKQYIEDGVEYIISKMDYYNLKCMEAAAKRHPLYEHLFAGGAAEISCYFNIDDTLCKCRPDYIFEKDGTIFIVDVKTINSCDTFNIRKRISQANYHRQAAFYMDGVKSATGCDNILFINYFVEKVGNYQIKEDWFTTNHVGVVPVAIPAEDIEIGRREYQEALAKYKLCVAKGSFPSYDDAIGSDGDIMELGLLDYKKSTEIWSV